MSSNQSELRKALTTSSDGAALVPYDLEPVLHEELLKLQPLAALLQVIPAGGKTHEYTVRSSHPMGWFEGETTPAANVNSVYARKSVQTKIQRIWGSVTGFARAMDAKFIDALTSELEGSLEGMSNILEYGVLWGTADDVDFTGDPYQYSGLVARLWSYAPENVVDGGGDKLALADLDEVLALTTSYRALRSDPRAFIMSTRMKQVADGLQTRVQLPLRTTELLDGKIVMSQYGETPIMQSDYMAPQSESTSPELSGESAEGGDLDPEITYQYRISSITAYGEQVASEAVEVELVPYDPGDPEADPDPIPETPEEATANLSWDADPEAKLYAIWRSDDDGDTFNLLDVIPALTYGTDGTVNGSVETYVDDGSRSTIAVKPLETGEESILIVNLNPRRGAALVGKIDDMGRPLTNLFSYVELARVKDSYDYMLKGYLTLRLIHPNLVAMIRHVKLA